MRKVAQVTAFKKDCDMMEDGEKRQIFPGNGVQTADGEICLLAAC